MKFLSVLLLLLCLSIVQSSRVYRVRITSRKQLEKLVSFGEEFLADFWTTPGMGSVDVMIPEKLEPFFQQLRLESSVFIEDVEALIEEERMRMAAASKKKAEFFEEYQELDAIYEWMDDLVAAYPSLVSTFVLGMSYEGRQIRGLKIKANRGATQEFFFNGGIHSREWVGVATTLYMANEIVTKYGQDTNVTYMLNNLDWTIVPVLNPDGYVYTFDGDRLWRKNRQPTPGAICIGTDLNRNWPFQWATGGSSANPCTDSYHGPSPNSGPETYAAINYLSSLGHRLAAYLDIHAYSQLLMYPWGYTTQLPANNAHLSRVGNAAAAALTAVYGTQYDVGNIANIIYVASGSSADYAYGALGVLNSFAFELRDLGRYGFLLPADQIIPSGIETFEALKVMAIQGVIDAKR